MIIEITTPTLLFSAITLLMLAYTNRFLAIANLVRQFHSMYKENPDKKVLKQINNFKMRLKIMRNMQFFGILSFLFCVLCMFFIYAEAMAIANTLFVGSLVLLMISLILSLWEIYISVDALDVQLSDIENEIIQ
jgi:hypothetical protein